MANYSPSIADKRTRSVPFIITTSNTLSPAISGAQSYAQNFQSLQQIQNISSIVCEQITLRNKSDSSLPWSDMVLVDPILHRGNQFLMSVLIPSVLTGTQSGNGTTADHFFTIDFRRLYDNASFLSSTEDFTKPQATSYVFSNPEATMATITPSSSSFNAWNVYFVFASAPSRPFIALQRFDIILNCRAFLI
jgi:hypothetical protein